MNIGFFFMISLESSVLFSYFLRFKDLLWLLCLSLDFVLVIPLYETCSFLKTQ